MAAGRETRLRGFGVALSSTVGQKFLPAKI